MKAIPLILTICLIACTPHSLHETKNVVAQADSLRAEGQLYDDSAHLAQAYATLGQWQWFYPDEYVHSCYYYGRLLREKDNPVAAIQCFINATHSRSHDYQILGRVYSNMGSICHLASEFQLSYDMYAHSADIFLRDHDTLSYYYDLTNMALELAEQGKKDSCFGILKLIDYPHGQDSCLMAYCLFSQAQAFLNCAQYDSAIVNAHLSRQYFPQLSSSLLQLSQAYSYIGIKDSAVYYANLVLTKSHLLFERNNALYILTNDDEARDKESIREVAADRADTQKLLEIRQGKMSQAVQLLKQDLARKPDFVWLYTLMVTLVVVGIGISIYVYRKHKKQALLSQKIEHLETTYTDLRTTKLNHLEQTCATLRASKNLQTDLCWRDYGKMCTFVNEHFYLLAGKLKNLNVLNETEIRLCVLVLIGLSRTEIANTLPYASNSVGKLKDLTAKLLGTTGKNLHDFLLKMAIKG